MKAALYFLSAECLNWRLVSHMHCESEAYYVCRCEELHIEKEGVVFRDRAGHWGNTEWLFTLDGCRRVYKSLSAALMARAHREASA